MKVYLNHVSGMGEAIISMYMSKRSWSPNINKEIHYICSSVNDRKGVYLPKQETNDERPQECFDRYNEYMSTLLKWGTKHITLLKFIDISFTVEGLHRAGQDDWDSHAKRFDNRIIRASTRLSTFSDGEKSDYYKGKIKYPFEALQDMGISLEDEYTDQDGTVWVKTDFGYINKQYENQKDVRRGLYPLAIPSNFIFSSNLADFSHVYKERNQKSGANPEVKECCEMIVDKLIEAQPLFSRELLMKIEC